MISQNEMKKRLKKATELCCEISNLIDYSNENIQDIDCNLERAVAELTNYMNILRQNIYGEK
jgi:hypothetical protein